MRCALQDGRRLSGLRSDFPHYIDERVDCFLGLRLGRLYHDGLMEQEREINRRSMEAEIEQSLGNVQCSCARHLF